MSSEVDEALTNLGKETVEIAKGKENNDLKAQLATEFARVVLPAWVEMIVLESGIVSSLLGFAELFHTPLVLVIGGLSQVALAGIFIQRRIKPNKAGKPSN